MPTDADTALVARAASIEPVFFHDLNITDVIDIAGSTRSQRATMMPVFDPAECAVALAQSSLGRAHCVPQYITKCERIGTALEGELGVGKQRGASQGSGCAVGIS